MCSLSFDTKPAIKTSTFVFSKLSSSCVAIIHAHRAHNVNTAGSKSYVGHTECPDAGLAPLTHKQKHVPRRRRRAESKDREWERGGILFIEFDAEHEKRDGISKSLLLRYRRPHLESRVIVTFNLFTIAGSSTWPEELSTFRVTCLFISCDRIFFEQFRTGWFLNFKFRFY